MNPVPDGPLQLDAGLDESLTRFAQMLEGMEDSPLSPNDVLKLQNALRDPKRSPLTPKHGKSKFRVMSINLRSGPAALAVEEQMPPQQLMMLNLVLAERFLTIHRHIEPTATLHTEPIVEAALTVEAERVIRLAAGKELNDVLRMKDVYLPVLETDDAFPFGELLSARNSSAGEAFRRIVATRDADGIAELTKVFCDSLSPSLRSRLGSGLFKFLLSFIPWGAAGPVVSLVETAIGEFAHTRTPVYFIDGALRRIGVTRKIALERGRASKRKPHQ